MKNDNEANRNRIRDILNQLHNKSIEDKIDRYLELEHQQIIGYHYFSDASSECIFCYRDGYFISTVMMSHAINEGIIKFITERNRISRNNKDGSTKSIEDLINELFNRNIISEKCRYSHLQIYRSFRADIHHMNPIVVNIPFKDLAKQNIIALSVIEREIFGYDFINGAISPHQPIYWDISEENMTTAYIRGI